MSEETKEVTEKKTTKKEVAKKSKNEIQAIDYSQYGNAGMENINHATELKPPYLKIMQTTSPEIDKTNPDHESKKMANDPLGTVEAGFWVDTARKRAVAKDDEELMVICCNRLKCFDKWSPKGSGRRVLARYEELPPEAVAGKTSDGKDVVMDSHKNEYVETAYMFVLYFHEDNWHPAILSLTGGRLASYRDWITLMFNQPEKCSFANIYSLTTYNKVYPDGSGYRFNPALVGPQIDEGLAEDCFKIYNMYKQEDFMKTTHSETSPETPASDGLDPETQDITDEVEVEA